jgi:C4-dicarboxylate transporter, DctM subunit
LDTLLIAIIALVIFFVLMSQGMPIAFAFALVGAVGMLVIKGLNPAINLLGSAPFTWATNGSLLSLPLFILMGQFVFQSGIGKDLFDTAHKWIGRVPGGLAVATTVAATAFGACCGASTAAAATFASVAYPEMKRYNYDDGLATGAITAGGSLSCLIPPSVAFIIFGVLTQSSIARLFIAGLLPGVLLAVLFIIVILVTCIRRPAMGPPGPSFSWKERAKSLSGLIPVIALFLLVLVGLFAGVFSSNEAGAIGAFGAFVIVLLKRKMTWKSFIDSVKGATLSTCFILTITIGAMIFSNFLAVAGFSEMFRGWMTGLNVPPFVIILVIVLLYVVLGCFMDGLSMLMLTLPILYPIIVDLGYPLVWFGVISTLLVEMALISPPVGMNVYVVTGITKVPMGRVFKGVMPFFAAMFVGIIILWIFPDIIMFLPNLING